jgi:hypothetical protein
MGPQLAHTKHHNFKEQAKAERYQPDLTPGELVEQAAQQGRDAFEFALMRGGEPREQTVGFGRQQDQDLAPVFNISLPPDQRLLLEAVDQPDSAVMADTESFGQQTGGDRRLGVRGFDRK